MKNLYLKTITAITVSNMLADSTFAQSGGTLKSVIGNTKENIDTIPSLIRIVCYIAALAFGISGVMKLKEYMDQPGKTPITGALGRLLVGAFLVAIPTILSVLASSTTGSGNTISVDDFDLT